MKEELDNRDVVGEVYHTTKILNRIKDSHKDMTGLILKHTRATKETVHCPKGGNVIPLIG